LGNARNAVRGNVMDKPWQGTSTKQFLLAWGIMYGGCFIIAETIDPEIGFYLALGTTFITLFLSPQSKTLLGGIQGWLESNVLSQPQAATGNTGSRDANGHVIFPTTGGG
jgi:hypothetical protein